MKRVLKAAILIGLVILIGKLLLWIRPDWRAELSIRKLGIEKDGAVIGSECPAMIQFNTFTDETNHTVIENIYASACRKFENLAGGKKIETYSWSDEEGWPGITTILQLPDTYFAVTAFVGNDADTVTIQAVKGRYCGPVHIKNPDLKALPEWKLPDWFLKTEWASR